MGDKEDLEPPPQGKSKNDKEAERWASQYDIIVSELYPWIAQQYQMKMDEEDDPYEKVSSVRNLFRSLPSISPVEKNENFTYKSERSSSSFEEENRVFGRTIEE